MHRGGTPTNLSTPPILGPPNFLRRNQHRKNLHRRLNRRHSRIWTDAPDWTKDAAFMERLDEWCTTGRIRYREDELHQSAAAASWP